MTVPNQIQSLPWGSPPTDAIHEIARAKVNWFLEVVRRRSDGYHDIVTEMETLDWADELWVRSRQDGVLSLRVGGEPRLVALSGDPASNLVVRAAQLLLPLAAGRGAELWLEKRVPAGAGLGGGSSDAVAALRGLNRAWGLGLSASQLRKLAGQLGSDTAFFVEGGRALCTGRGEIVERLPSAEPRNLVMIWPGFPVSTPSVYLSSALDLASPRKDWMDTSRGGAVFNRLDVPCRAVSKEVARLMDSVSHAIDASRLEGLRIHLSGSGSCCFVPVENRELAERVERVLRECAPEGSVVRTCVTTV